MQAKKKTVNGIEINKIVDSCHASPFGFPFLLSHLGLTEMSRL